MSERRINRLDRDVTSAVKWYVFSIVVFCLTLWLFGCGKKKDCPPEEKCAPPRVGSEEPFDPNVQVR